MSILRIKNYCLRFCVIYPTSRVLKKFRHFFREISQKVYEISQEFSIAKFRDQPNHFVRTYRWPELFSRCLVDETLFMKSACILQP
jgi:hypothetical protein